MLWVVRCPNCCLRRPIWFCSIRCAATPLRDRYFGPPTCPPTLRGPASGRQMWTACARRAVEPPITPSRTDSLHDGAQLLRKHHVARDLQLPRHECLHAIQLALRHGDKIFVLHSDRHIWLFAFTPCCGAIAILQVDAELLAIADHQLKNSAAQLDHLCSPLLHTGFNHVEYL